MTADWEQYSLYGALEIDAGANADDIKAAHERLASGLDPDTAPEEEKKGVALSRLAADAALDALSDEKAREECDARLDEMQKAASRKKKIESKRKGKQQEEQSVEEDEKLQKATERFDSARGSLVDFYFDRLFKAARQGRFETVPTERLMEWLSSERAEAAKSQQQSGGRVSFKIDWSGFTSIQDKRKERGEEISRLIDELASGIQ